MNETQLKKRAAKLVTKLTALGFTKDGKPMVIDQAYELVAAEEGFRNQHVLRKALNAAADLDQPATEPTAGAMQQAMAELEARWGHEHGYYARADWRQDVSEGNTRLGYWEWVQHAIEANDGEENHCSVCGRPLDDEDGMDGASTNGMCGNCANAVEDREVFAIEEVEPDLFQSVFPSALAEHSQLHSSIQDAREHIAEITDVATGAAARVIVPHDDSSDDRCGNCAPDQESSTIARNRAAADKAFEDYDFGPMYSVADHDGWAWDGESILTKNVYLEADHRLPDEPTKKVVFHAEVCDGEVVAISVE